MTPEHRQQLVDAAKAYTAKKQREAELAAGERVLQAAVRELKDSVPTKAEDYESWRNEQDKVLLHTLLRALSANPKLAAEMKILLRGDKP